jgi:uncharacterized protein
MMKVYLICFLTLLSVGAVHAQKISASDSALLASMPALPAVDTAAAPADELTTEIRKLLNRTNVMSAALHGLKNLMALQRNGNPQIPKEFFTRFNQQVENGRIGRLFENMLIRIYREKFTVAEIREINKFYDTPIGKKLAVETPGIMSASQAQGEELGKYIGLEIARELIKEGKWK